MRVLALHLPDIACEIAILRRESQAGVASALGLRAPLAVVVAPNAEPLTGKSVLFAVTERARRLGVRAGQTLASARALVGELDVQQVSPQDLDTALGRVAEVLLGLAPTVSVQSPDTVLLDVTGLAHLHGNEAALLDEACDGAKSLGHRVRGAIADGVHTARAVARFAPIPRVVVPVGNDEKALGPLPVAALPIDDEVQSYLGRLGLFNVDDVKKQPLAGLAARLGERAPLVLELLHGRDRTPLVPYEPPRVIVESLSWDEPIAGSEALLFVLRGLLGRVAARLLGRGEATTQLVVQLGLDAGIVRCRDREKQAARTSRPHPASEKETQTEIPLATTEELSFHFPVPISQANELLRAVHTRVERLTLGEASEGTSRPHGLLAPVVRLAVVADGIVRAPRVQLDLSRDTTVSPEALPVLLAELAADLGEDKIGKLGLEPSHLIEERSRLVPFYDEKPGAHASKSRGARAAKNRQLSLLAKTEEPIAPPTRLLRSPLLLTGTLNVGSFVTVAGVGLRAGKNAVPAAFTVKRVQRTERIEDATWWSAKPQSRDYALAYLEGEAGGALALLVRERRTGKIAVHGFY